MIRAFVSRSLPLLTALALLGGTQACQFNTDTTAATQRLPYLGEPDVVAPGDTVYPTLPTFTLTNQDRQTVTPATFAGKVYIADFFFATCPSICPKMQSEMLRVYEKYKNDKRVAFLSHTIDPEHDSIPVLREYAERLGVKDASQWHFVTAPRDTIFRLAGKYMVAAQRDASAPGGAVHSGAFVLVDPQRHIRGSYDGTNAEQVDQLLRDLPVLLQEVSGASATAAK
ncbi:SCO family protein [Hymenobacter busanensis]|uniref:SCO family protein n=1 Tax=Hymenobacter busanensis TaxID=2607656 RepID=A0A7L4ZS95_9BACT|nr:SCO family protein [Hymenobacter busanensis]KAA9327498.1 SCO family protein [Hymenobacter busanensis]QHJ06164.1 SCO family protein [Hymenobacter busanensis]